MAYYLSREAFLKSVFFAFAHELLMEMNNWQLKSPWYLGKKKKKKAFNIKFKICLHFFLKRRAFLSTVKILILVQSSSTTFVIWDSSALKKRMIEKPTILHDLIFVFIIF